MEKDYNFHQHIECMVIHFDNEYLTLKSSITPLNTLETRRETENYNYRGRACITYDEKKENVLNHGQDPNFKPKKEDVCIDNFLEKIYSYYDNGENFRDKDDEFALKAISEFLRLNLEESIYYREVTRKNPRAFHYIVIVPSEWDPEIKETIIRPLFISAGIILKEDSEDRLLFYTDLEATFYYLERCSKNMDRYDTIKLYEENQQSILCRISSDKNGDLSLNLDVIIPKNSTLNVPVFLIPVVTRSTFVSLSLLGFKEDIRSFIKSATTIKENKILNLMIDHILNYFSNKTNFWYDRDTTYYQEDMFWDVNLDNWGLARSQQVDVKKMTFLEIRDVIDSHIMWGLNKLLKHALGESRTLVLAFEYCPPFEKHTHPWIPWVEKVLESKEKPINSKYMPVMTAQDPNSHITLSDLMEETIQMSAVFLHSYINSTISSYAQDNLEASQDSSNVPLSPVYPDLKLNTIINIDISLRSTIISLSNLNEQGDTQEVFNTSSLSNENQALSLDKFLDISNITTLKLTKDGFDSIENIFPDYLDYFSKYNRHYKKNHKVEKVEKEKEKKVDKQKNLTKEEIEEKEKKEKEENEKMKVFPGYEERKLYKFSSKLKETLLTKIKTILSTKQESDSTQRNNSNTQQQKHIRVFLIVYLAYLKEIILKEKLEFDETGLKIGYVVSIEKMLLDNAIGTKSDFEEIVSASGIIKSEGTSNFSKIITRGEGLLPLLKRHKSSEFPLGSYFLLAHIHEEYVQFTLNQVMITGDFESEAASIIIKDKLVSIENIYNSLCVNVWNCVVQTESLTRLCNDHKCQSIYEVQELFSFEAKADFFVSLKSYMSEKIFKDSSEDSFTIPLTRNCKCAVYLSMNSMIELAWKPTFKRIAATLSSSLENTNLFGLYYDLNYLFGFIHFNKNAAYQKKIAYLLSAELNSKVVGKETSARCFIIEKLPDQFLHLKNDSKLPVFSQESFQRGNVTIVSKESFGYSITLPGSGIYDTIVPSSRDKKLGAVPNKIDKERNFLLLKKGDVIDHSGLEKSFSLKRISKVGQKDTDNKLDSKDTNKDAGLNDTDKEVNLKDTDIEEIVRISIFRVKNTDYFDNKSIIPLDNVSLEKLKIFELTNYKYNCDMPIIISVKYKSHLSSLYFSVKVKGQDAVLQENYLALNHSTDVNYNK